MAIKLITYNVNGIRSVINKGLINWLQVVNPDVICFQEIKLFETELVEHLFTEIGYHCSWFPAQKKGYSGVAIVSKQKPNSVDFGCNNKDFDFEGRSILAHFKDFSVLCAYFPSGTTGDIRQTVKYDFLTYIQAYINEIKTKHKNLIVCGDVNICHQDIDIHNPKSNQKTSGFLPEERAWVSSFLESGFTDCFRHINKEPHNYTWWSLRSGARAKNLGWRIDYVFANKEINHKILNAEIRSDVMFSDHCPLEITFDLNL